MLVFLAILIFYTSPIFAKTRACPHSRWPSRKLQRHGPPLPGLEELPSAPAAAFTGACCRVTRLAQSLQIFCRVGTARRDGHDVVNIPRRCDPAGPLAQCAQWMRCDIGRADPSPSFVVSLAAGRIPMILFVHPVRLFLMLVAVPGLREERTAGMAARTLRFSGHSISLPGHAKSPQSLCSEGRFPSPTF